MPETLSYPQTPPLLTKFKSDIGRDGHPKNLLKGERSKVAGNVLQEALVRRVCGRTLGRTKVGRHLHRWTLGEG